MSGLQMSYLQVSYDHSDFFIKMRIIILFYEHAIGKSSESEQGKKSDHYVHRKLILKL